MQIIRMEKKGNCLWVLDRLSSGGEGWRAWGGGRVVGNGTEVAGGQWADSLSMSLEGSEGPCLDENWDPLEIQPLFALGFITPAPPRHPLRFHTPEMPGCCQQLSC